MNIKQTHTDPIYVQPAATPYQYQQPIVVQPYTPPAVNASPQIQREHIPVPVYPTRQERSAPRAEFEAVRFIPTEPHICLLSRGDTSLPSVNKARLPKGKSRIVIGKTKILSTDQNACSEVVALQAKYHADELIVHIGRRWSDDTELLIKFVVWK